MRKILAITLKDTLIRFISPLEWAFFIILPIFFILILSGGTGPAQDQRVSLYVVNQAQSSLSTSLISELERSTSVRPVSKDLEEALTDFDSRQVSAVLIIPEGFTVSALQKGQAEVELRQQPNRTAALIDQQAVQVAINRLSSIMDIANTSTEQAAKRKPFTTDSSRQTYFDAAFASAQSLMESAPQRVSTVEGNTEDTINYDPRANSTAGQMITWVFIPLIGLSGMFAQERQAGTLRRILVTPTSKAMYIGGTVFGQVLTAVVQMIILMSFGAIVFKTNWGHSPVGPAMMIFSSCLAAAALGSMLGTFVKTENQASGLSIMIGMVMAMMGGCWYPIELFPQMIRNAAKILPTSWAMGGLLDISVRGQGVEGVWLESLVLCGFALVFFTIGVWRFKYE